MVDRLSQSCSVSRWIWSQFWSLHLTWCSVGFPSCSLDLASSVNRYLGNLASVSYSRPRCLQILGRCPNLIDLGLSGCSLILEFGPPIRRVFFGALSGSSQSWLVSRFWLVSRISFSPWSHGQIRIQTSIAKQSKSKANKLIFSKAETKCRSDSIVCKYS